jgi:gamma-glutamylputrescine oxidase
MGGETFWKNPSFTGFGKFAGEISCDYLIIGGGITGIATAYYLHKKGAKNIVLIEKATIASGASGRAAGILTPNTELDLRELIDAYGKKRAIAFWNGLRKELQEIEKLQKKHHIDIECERASYLYAAYHSSNIDAVKAEFLSAKNAKLRARWVKNVSPYVNTTIFDQGLVLPDAITVNPLKLSQNLAAYLNGCGVSIYEQTPLLEIRDHVAIIPDGKINFKKAIFATDTAFMDKKRLCKVTIGVTRQLTLSELRQTHLSKRKVFWDTAKEYHYCRLTKDNRLLVGAGSITLSDEKGRNDLIGGHKTEIIRFLKELFPAIDLELEYLWSGAFGFPPKGIPQYIADKDIVQLLCTTGQTLSFWLARKAATTLLSPIKNGAACSF